MTFCWFIKYPQTVRRHSQYNCCSTCPVIRDLPGQRGKESFKFMAHCTVKHYTDKMNLLFMQCENGHIKFGCSHCSQLYDILTVFVDMETYHSDTSAIIVEAVSYAIEALELLHCAPRRTCAPLSACSQCSTEHRRQSYARFTGHIYSIGSVVMLQI